MVRFEERYKFTVVGKFSNTMPRMEIIRKSFIARIKLRGVSKLLTSMQEQYTLTWIISMIIQLFGANSTCISRAR